MRNGLFVRLSFALVCLAALVFDTQLPIASAQSSNPVPVVNSLSTPFPILGGLGYYVTVTGSNFIPASVVQWNASDRATTYSSSTQLIAVLTPADVQAGTGLVTVFNPTPGGGLSNALTFSSNPTSPPPQNPVPAISSLSPSSAIAGTGAFTLTVIGSNFVSGAVVQWNGSNRSTTFVSANQLTASITAPDVAAAGAVQVTVLNPSPGGGVSKSIAFAVSLPPSNPVPVIGTLFPSAVFAGNPGFNLMVNGSKFVSGAVVQWNGSNRITTFNSSTQLTAQIFSSDIAAEGAARVTVINPGPGGGTSNVAAFSILSLSGAGGAAPAVTVTVWRPADGNWYIANTNSPFLPIIVQWGTSGDIPVPGDYDGDGILDYAIWRPSENTWYVLLSGNPNRITPIKVQLGISGDIPVPGDYDGDGKTDMAVWRPSDGTWHIIPSSAPNTTIVQQWGTTGDIPVPGNYFGDGKTDMAVWRPAAGVWYILPSSTAGASTPVAIQWGASGDVPVPGDYDGDGKTDWAVWRPSEGNWYILRSSDPDRNAPLVQNWGTAGDIPAPGDYDRDGKADFAIWRPSDGTWHIIPSSTPNSSINQQWGTQGDDPLFIPYKAQSE